MNMLDKDYSYDDLVRWGALQLYGETQVRGWFGPRPRKTISDTLALPAPPSIVFWAVMRPELLDERLLHGLAVDLALAVLARIRNDGRYIDFRSERVLATKRAWVLEQISLGELSSAVLSAERARIDVAELPDETVWLGAKAAVQASGADGRVAFSDVYYTALEHDASVSNARAILDGVKASLGVAESHWSMRHNSGG